MPHRHREVSRIEGFSDAVFGFATTLLVVSNQQERTPLTNDAISEDAFELPFLVTKVVLHD